MAVASLAHSASQPLATAGGMLLGGRGTMTGGPASATPMKPEVPNPVPLPPEKLPVLPTLPLPKPPPAKLPLLVKPPLKATLPVVPPKPEVVPEATPPGATPPLPSGVAPLPPPVVLPLSLPEGPPALPPLSPKQSRAPVLPPQPIDERVARAQTHPSRTMRRFMSPPENDSSDYRATLNWPAARGSHCLRRAQIERLV